MMRSLIRLKTVELFLKRADYQEQLRKTVTEPQVIAAQKTIVLPNQERSREN